MARMLETLKRNDPPRSGPLPFTIAKPPGDDCVMEWALDDAESPYIEVGGPGKVVEGSAEVLTVAHPPQAKQPPHRPPEKPLVASGLAAQLAETKPLTVAFEPWTGPRVDSTGIAREIIAHHQPDHAISKQYAELWSTMSAGLAGKACPLMLLVGLKAHVGTTTVLLNLAIAAARQARRRVAVIDARRQRPDVATRLGFTPEVGLLEVLAGQTALEQALVGTVVSGLHVLPLAGHAEDGAFAPEAIAWLSGRLRTRFDAVLLDGPELERTAELTALMPAVDAWFLVAPRDETRSLPRPTVEAIARFGGKLRGVLHTQFQV